MVGLMMGEAELDAVFEEPALANGVEGVAGNAPFGLVIFLHAPPLAPLLLPALPSLAALPGEPFAILILSAYDPSALNTDGWFGD